MRVLHCGFQMLIHFILLSHKLLSSHTWSYHQFCFILVKFMKLLLLYISVTSGLLIISHRGSLTWNPGSLRRLSWALLQIKRFDRRWFIVISTDNMLFNGWIILSIDESPLSFGWLYRFDFIYHSFTIDALESVSHIWSVVLVLQNGRNLRQHISWLKI